MEKFSKFTNVELANTLGNLLQRCLPFNTELKYPSHVDARPGLNNSRERDLISRLDSLRSECDEYYEMFNYYKAIHAIMARLRDANLLVQEYKPWELSKSPNGHGKIDTLLFLVYESLRVCGILLQPIIPDLSTRLLDRLNVDSTQRSYDFAKVDLITDTTRRISSNNDIIFKRV